MTTEVESESLEDGTLQVLKMQEGARAKECRRP